MRDSATPYMAWDGAPLTVDFGIDRIGMFEAGQNFFQLLLEVIAMGDGFADFGHTVSLVGLRVADGYSLTLPDGVYAVDPGDSRHYILAAAAVVPSSDVPEPSSAALALLGLAAFATPRRRRHPAA